MCPLYSRKFEIFERSVSALFWCPLYSKEYGISFTFGNILKENEFTNNIVKIIVFNNKLVNLHKIYVLWKKNYYIKPK